MRTKESGGRRSRTLKPGDDSGDQLQGKAAQVQDGPRFFQPRWFTEAADMWTHLVVDPERSGLDAIVAIGTGRTEPESWEMARAMLKASRGIEL